jgi:hypothetical protein
LRSTMRGEPIGPLDERADDLTADGPGSEQGDPERRSGHRDVTEQRIDMAQRW